MKCAKKNCWCKIVNSNTLYTANILRFICLAFTEFQASFDCSGHVATGWFMFLKMVNCRSWSGKFPKVVAHTSIWPHHSISKSAARNDSNPAASYTIPTNSVLVTRRSWQLLLTRLGQYRKRDGLQICPHQNHTRQNQLSSIYFPPPVRLFHPVWLVWWD